MTDSCPDFESLLARSADGALDAHDEATLASHLATCAGCRGALADQRAVREALAARPLAYARPDFARRVAQAIDADRSWLDRLDFRAWTWRLAPVAAALSLATWLVVQNTAASLSPSATDTSGDSDLPVAAALWDESVSDTSMLSLMLRAGANDRLAETYKER